jgi:hypothetical protein
MQQIKLKAHQERICRVNSQHFLLPFVIGCQPSQLFQIIKTENRI